MKFLKKLLLKLTCKHTTMVTLRDDDQYYTAYCSTCDTKFKVKKVWNFK